MKILGFIFFILVFNLESTVMQLMPCIFTKLSNYTTLENFCYPRKDFYEKLCAKDPKVILIVEIDILDQMKVYYIYTEYKDIKIFLKMVKDKMASRINWGYIDINEYNRILSNIDY